MLSLTGEPTLGMGIDSALSEDALLQAARSGDEAALTSLLAMHEHPLYRLCRGVLNHPEDAEDAVQETFLRALRNLAGFRLRSSFRTWLFRIGIHVCLDWKRARAHHTSWNDPHLEMVSSPNSPESTVVPYLDALHALSRLMPRQRTLLVLKEVEGWSVAEIAAVLEWSPTRVQNELFKARRALAQWREQAAREEQQQ